MIDLYVSEGNHTAFASRSRTHLAALGRIRLPHAFFSTDTKNPSVPVRRGVIKSPSADCSVAAAKSSALSHSTVVVCDGGTTANSGWRATKFRICSPFSCGNTEQVI